MNDAGSEGTPERVPSIFAEEEGTRLEHARARLRRERERSHRLAARVDALEAELASVRDSAAYRLTYPLRRLASAIPPSAYNALRGRRARSGDPGLPPIPRAPVLTGERPWAMLIDDWLPEPNRDSGSIDIVNMAQSLSTLGFAVLFAARRDLSAKASKRTFLESLGARILDIEDAPDVETFLRSEGPLLSVVVLNRLYCGGELFETVRSYAPGAVILFNTIDLHWVRLKREAELSGDGALAQAAAQARARELQLAREADAVIVVSSTELALLAREAPDAYAVELPLARPLAPTVTPYAARDGIGFIGGFKHQPNLDALRWFVEDIWPLVLRRLPSCRLSVVGSDHPADLLAGLPGRVEALGHVPDVEPWFKSIRLTVAPLRYGAGAKGKVASSMSAGVPCVGTAIALEGMRLDGEGVIAAETPEDMANAIVRLHEDPDLWERSADAALAAANERFSLARWQERFAGTLASLGVLPEKATGFAPGPYSGSAPMTRS